MGGRAGGSQCGPIHIRTQLLTPDDLSPYARFPLDDGAVLGFHLSPSVFVLTDGTLGDTQ